jgi:hypothetical protein
MPKIIFEFQDTEEEEARTALDGGKWKSALWDIDQELRGITKYAVFDNRDATEEEVNVASVIREKIHQTLQAYSLNLD